MKKNPEIAAAIQLLIESGYGVFKMQAGRQEPERATGGKQTYTVSEFCRAHEVSRTHFYALLKAGTGPEVMKVGRKTLISKGAAEEWVRLSEGRS